VCAYQLLSFSLFAVNVSFLWAVGRLTEKIRFALLEERELPEGVRTTAQAPRELSPIEELIGFVLVLGYEPSADCDGTFCGRVFSVRDGHPVDIPRRLTYRGKSFRLFKVTLLIGRTGLSYELSAEDATFGAG